MGRIGAWFGGSTTGMKALVALACLVLLVSSGCSAEQPSAPSDSHKEAKNTQGSERHEARSDTRKSTTEAAKPAPKKVTGLSAPEHRRSYRSPLAQGRFPAYLGLFPDHLLPDRSLDPADHPLLLSANSQ
jgi:hypothetical protein